MTSKKDRLSQAQELFLNPPTGSVEQAEASKYLRDILRLSRADIGAILGISERQVKTRLCEWKNYVLKGLIPTGKLDLPEWKEEPLEEVREDESARLQTLESRREARAVLREDTFITKLTEAVAPYLPTSHDLSEISRLYREAHSGPRYSKGSEEVAVATMSDLHLCLHTKDHTFETGMKANDRFMQKVIQLTELQRTHCDVRTLHLNSIGDNIQGTSNFSNQRWTVDRPAIEQAEALTEVLVRNVELALLNFDFVQVNFRDGNHEYIVPAKVSPDPAASNWATVVGRSLSWAFRNHPRVKINMNDEWYTIVDILGTRMLLTHGHVISGSGSFDGLIKTVNKWSAILPPFTICCLGHFHRISRLPLPRVHGQSRPRTLYTNGTAIMEDDFLQRIGGSPTPAWWLFYIGARGVTNEYAVDLYGEK